MKTGRILLVLGMIMFCSRANAQEQELEELALDIEKLAQFKKILADLEKGYEVLAAGYNTIKNISQGNFDLHKAFLDGLLAVSPAVANYKKIAAITAGQLRLVKECSSAVKRCRLSGNFSLGELRYMEKVFEKLTRGSVSDLDALLVIITAGKLRMSDDERLAAIDRLEEAMQERLSFLQHFNNGNAVLSLQRSKEKNDVQTGKRLQGTVR